MLGDRIGEEGSGLSVGLVLLVVAPLFGLFVQRFVTRNLGDSPVSVSLVVTVGLFVGLIGFAQWVWKPEARSSDRSAS